jgi:hypothetical protein
VGWGGGGERRGVGQAVAVAALEAGAQHCDGGPGAKARVGWVGGARDGDKGRLQQC